MSRLIRDPHGTYMFLGPSANLSAVQSIRKIVHSVLGAGYFAEIPAEDDLVDDISPFSINQNEVNMEEPPRPSVTDTRYYLRWYNSATSDVFDLFGYEELTTEIIPWLERPPSTDSDTCINFLVLAIGAQCGPEDRDEETKAYFNYARDISSRYLLGTASITIIQIYCLITTYLLNAARPHAASMNLGPAIRAAHSLGIHRADINGLFPTTDSFKRERIWRVLRLQDLFLSTTLGHHPSTTETRDTTSQQGYSASADLCLIFEKILSQVYLKQEISPSVLQNVTKHHREWASHFREGLMADHISADEYVSSGNERKSLNIGLCHLKEAYYWTIMLVTRPYLMDLVERRLATEMIISPPPSVRNDTMSPSIQPADTLLAHASVNSAVLTIDLLRCLLDVDQIPKRLPYVVNSVLNSALVLGIAYFGDLDHLFPLGHAMDVAERLLDRFQMNDAQAQWSLRIVRDLRNSCNQFVKRRCDRHLRQQGALVEGLFGYLNPLRGQDHIFITSRSSPSTSQGWDKGTELGDLDGMIEAELSGYPSKPPIDDANAIWDQLFCGSISGSYLELNPGGLPLEWQ
ncbi:uncharacterized protein N7484_007913 [Penicillium longicatenatum]|uniref:uncharacterized protein n=1 Tax=Penicillium longicatenatum TaxID=1561947 RepID=UPI002548A419|nr:uncharacterized protein N7484_007913 [Penicillium longicatenatum]KAJ5640051.1 hypothetical protein N7484_007913 [Penicillium longicatenatum]